MTDSSRCYNVRYGHVLAYTEIFFDQEDHREVYMHGSIEEHNAIFFMTLVWNQTMNSGISRRKVDAAITKDQEVTSQSFLRRRLCMTLEEWKLEHFCHPTNN